MMSKALRLKKEVSGKFKIVPGKDSGKRVLGKLRITMSRGIHRFESPKLTENLATMILDQLHKK